ncbi:MAG: hypothetical protein LBF51_00345 [Zoogloeaceae bacterium]|nr:hypothetical protein [Zoogloeaceae bacterium]
MSAVTVFPVRAAACRPLSRFAGELAPCKGLRFTYPCRRLFRRKSSACLGVPGGLPRRFTPENDGGERSDVACPPFSIVSAQGSKIAIRHDLQ